MKSYYDWLLSIRVDGNTVGLIAGYITVGAIVLIYALVVVTLFVSALLEYQ